jgi:S-adenosylmethionine decarboxylase
LGPETLRETESSAVDSRVGKPGLSIGSGTEWLVDARGCDPELLQNLELLQELCTAIVDDLGLNVIGSPQWHRFPGPGGVTGLYLLSESHLACHTYPEFRLLTLNLYCCRPRAEWPWKEELQNRFRASDVCVRRMDRGPRDGEVSA